MFLLQQAPQLARPPFAPIPDGLGGDQVGDGTRSPMRAVVRKPAALLQTLKTFGAVALKPLVACLSTDGESLAQLGHCVDVLLTGHHKTDSLFHGFGLMPRHDRSALVKHHAA
jgi:hypothetical protein